MFYQVVQKGGNLSINYIKIFKNAKAFSISVGNSNTEDQGTHTFLENLHNGGNYSAHIASHQPELRIAENLLVKIIIFVLLKN